MVDAGLSFVFTDGHADMAYSEFFNDLGELGQVDWEIMKSHYWNDTADDGDRRRRRQAEFLVHDFVPAKFIEEVGVINSVTAGHVQELFARTGFMPRIVVHREWYY